MSGEDWPGQQMVSPGEGVNPEDPVTVDVVPPPGVGGAPARAVELTAQIDPDGRWDEDDEGDNAIEVRCESVGTQLTDANVTVPPEGASCSFQSSEVGPFLDLTVPVAWVLEGIDPSAQVEPVARDVNGWSGSTVMSVGDGFAGLQLFPPEGVTDVPTFTTVTVTVDPSDALPESVEDDNRTEINCPR